MIENNNFFDPKEIDLNIRSEEIHTKYYSNKSQIKGLR
jgi:hypothetical protein